MEEIGEPRTSAPGSKTGASARTLFFHNPQQMLGSATWDRVTLETGINWEMNGWRAALHKGISGY